MTTPESDSIKHLKNIISEQRMKYFNAIQNKEHYFRLLNCCEISINPSLTITRAVNPYPVIGEFDDKQPATALFSSPDADAYFQWFLNVPDVLRNCAESAQRVPWELKFASRAPHTVSVLDFIALPEDTWILTEDHGVSMQVGRAEGMYLIYPEQIVSKTEDFRIEYSARTDDAPCDLSCVVGPTPVYSDTYQRFIRIPEDAGYCFGFGALNNERTQLQKGWRPVTSVKRSIEKGVDYRCVAERVGGRLRFFIDGEMIYEYIDPLPILKSDHGYVGFYTYGIAHRFENITIATRPTCLPADILDRINKNTERTFTLKSDPSRRVRVHMVAYNDRTHVYTFLLQAVG